jgi:hypothetical protein
VSNYFDLRQAVKDGPPEQLFELGDYLVDRFAQRNLTSGEMLKMSGADIAREVLLWAKETSQ